MRVSNLIVAVLALAMALPATAMALDARDSITDDCQIQWVRDHRDGPGVISAGYPQYNTMLGVIWGAEAPAGWTGGPWEIQIGDAYDTPASGAGMLGCYICPYQNTMVNWSAFSQFSLDVTNTSTTASLDAELIINTGATGIGEPDNLYESGWVTIGPSATVTLLRDLTSVVNLNHVSNISFKLRSEEETVEVIVVGGEDVTPTVPASWGTLKTTYEN
jgi:hypothetical protein